MNIRDIAELAEEYFAGVWHVAGYSASEDRLALRCETWDGYSQQTVSVIWYIEPDDAEDRPVVWLLRLIEIELHNCLKATQDEHDRWRVTKIEHVGWAVGRPKRVAFVVETDTEAYWLAKEMNHLHQYRKHAADVKGRTDMFVNLVSSAVHVTPPMEERLRRVYQLHSNRG